MQFTDFLTDEYIFHFTKRITFLEYIIPDKKICFNPSKYCNDPREYNNFTIERAGFRDAFSPGFANKRNKINDTIKSDFKIACFTQNIGGRGDDYLGYLKSRMWSQYGDIHSGVCLVFNKKIFLNEINNVYPPDNIYEGLIIYKCFNELFDSFKDLEKALSTSKEDSEVIKENIKCIFFEKHIDYQDEQEYRIVIYDKSKEFIKIAFSNSLCGLIVCDKFPPVYDDIINNFIQSNKSGNDMNLIKLKWENGLPSTA